MAGDEAIVERGSHLSSRCCSGCTLVVVAASPFHRQRPWRILRVKSVAIYKTCYLYFEFLERIAREGTGDDEKDCGLRCCMCM